MHTIAKAIRSGRVYYNNKSEHESISICKQKPSRWRKRVDHSFPVGLVAVAGYPAAAAVEADQKDYWLQIQSSEQPYCLYHGKQIQREYLFVSQYSIEKKDHVRRLPRLPNVSIPSSRPRARNPANSPCCVSAFLGGCGWKAGMAGLAGDVGRIWFESVPVDMTGTGKKEELGWGELWGWCCWPKRDVPPTGANGLLDP
jgi:hypothetical protein